MKHYKNFNINSILGEEWASVDGFEHGYMVSNLGRMKAISRIIKRTRWGLEEGRNVKERILKQRQHMGYMRIGLHKDDKIIDRAVHRLLAQKFIPNPENKPFINHKNGIRDDNRVINLEWCTRSENMIHAFKTGLKTIDAEKNSKAKLTNKQALKIFKSKSATIELCKKYKVTDGTIYYIRSGRGWISVTGGAKKNYSHEP